MITTLPIRDEFYRLVLGSSSGYGQALRASCDSEITHLFGYGIWKRPSSDATNRRGRSPPVLNRYNAMYRRRPFRPGRAHPMVPEEVMLAAVPV